MFRHNPELPAYASVAHGSAPELACLATDSFEQRVPWPPKADGEEKLNRRIEKVLLQEVNNATFHVGGNCCPLPRVTTRVMNLHRNRHVVHHRARALKCEPR